MNKIFLLFFLLFFAACNDEKLELNQKAPNLKAFNTQNQKVNLRFNGIELVEFWQNGCAACLKVMASLDEFAKKNNILIYSINSVDKLELIKEYEKTHNYSSMIFLQDSLDITWQRYEIFALPTLFIIKDGIVKEKILGDRGINYIQERIKAYL